VVSKRDKRDRLPIKQGTRFYKDWKIEFSHDAHRAVLPLSILAQQQVSWLTDSSPTAHFPGQFPHQRSVLPCNLCLTRHRPNVPCLGCLSIWNARDLESYERKFKIVTKILRITSVPEWLWND